MGHQNSQPSCSPHEDKDRQASCDQDRSHQQSCDQDKSHQASCDEDKSHQVSCDQQSSCGGDSHHSDGSFSILSNDFNGNSILSGNNILSVFG
jgi:hypothetical protein